MLACIAKWKKLWFLLKDTKPNSSNKKTLEDLNIDDKKDGLLYIITMSIKLGVLKNLMTFENPKLL